MSVFPLWCCPSSIYPATCVGEAQRFYPSCSGCRSRSAAAPRLTSSEEANWCRKRSPNSCPSHHDRHFLRIFVMIAPAIPLFYRPSATRVCSRIKPADAFVLIEKIRKCTSKQGMVPLSLAMTLSASLIGEVRRADAAFNLKAIRNS